MKKLSGVAVVTTAEGERVSYTYMELDDNLLQSPPHHNILLKQPYFASTI